MNCQTCRIEIEEIEATERLSDEAQAHLSVCALCRAFHDERQSLKRLVGGLGTVSAPPDFDFRLRARISAAKATGNHRSSWRSFLASAPAIGLAATFALLVAGVVIYNQTKSKSSPADKQVVAATAELPEQKPVQAIANPTPAVTASDVTPRASDINTNDGGGVVAVAGKRQRSRVQESNRNVARRESSQPGANDSMIMSNDTAARSAVQIIPSGAAPFNAGMNPIVELPVRSASQPMRIFVDDKSGAKRTLTLEPVVFGSQDLMGRNSPRTASSQGIW